jgi:gamma-glutamylcyclotransferase (GGCT)/AIG2-like uncharacterized protein YtfP
MGIREGAVRGRLLDCGPYPTLMEGDDWVLGELWTFAPSDMALVCEVIDRAEGCGTTDDPPLYRRMEIEALVVEGNAMVAVPCYAYLLANRSAEGQLRPMSPSRLWNDRVCSCWPDSRCLHPKTLEEEAAILSRQG